eukprot:3916599-Pyramimonas_sp.AAC.1
MTDKVPAARLNTVGPRSHQDSPRNFSIVEHAAQIMHIIQSTSQRLRPRWSRRSHSRARELTEVGDPEP